MCDREQLVSLLYYLFGDNEEEAIHKLKEHHRMIETYFGFDYLKDDKICVCAHILEKLQHDGYIFPVNKLSRYILSGRCPHVQRHTPRESVGTTSTNLVLVAVALGKLQTVQYIVESGCSLDCSTSVLKMTPLHIAVHRNDLRLFQYLVSQGVDVNRCCRGCEGEYSTLMLAVQGNCNEIVKELLTTTDINGNFRNINHKGALCCAVQNCSEDMINMLLSSGIKPTVGTLQKALDSNNSRVLELILSVGAPNLHKSVYKAAQQGNASNDQNT
ncbi:hypothetical protein KUTeg_018335 [Tegillarca granosa]|uniref:Uncharacterized protein n=1 Tax=Tegillarca granosa TaxID=220873 RepID=A0ABQ9EME3_TEGGR|nr:hypothetical protein KUTeg_018335 [Tegillarca granosa]